MASYIPAVALILVIVYLIRQLSRQIYSHVGLPVVVTTPENPLSFALSEAHKQYPDTAFLLPFDPPRVIIPMSLFHEVAYAKRDQLSFHGVLREEDQTYWTRISILRPEMIQAIRFNLTKNLGKALPLLQEELQYSLRKELGDPESWVAVTLHPLLRRLVALLVGRLLLGLPLSRDEQWLDLSINSSKNLGMVRTAILKWNKILRPLVVPFLPEVRMARQVRMKAIRFLEPHLKELLNNNQHAKHRATEIGSEGTAFFWMLEHIDENNVNTSVMADNYLEMMAVSVNGTAKACYQAIFDILSSPQYIPALRNEIEKAIAEDGLQKNRNGDPYMAKATYTKLRFLDSCIKETLRCNPSQLISMNRYLETDYEFSNGLKLKRGTLTGFNMWGVTHSTETTTYSPELNAAVGNLGPEVYDGFRFARLRTMTGQRNRYLAATTGSEESNFGHGPLACPGRFFGIEVIKVIIVDLILHYDIRLPPEAKGKRPTNTVVDQYVVPDSAAQVHVQRRAV